MTCVRSLVFKAFLVILLWAAASDLQPADNTVYSRYMSDQILPCSFPSGDGLLVHWYKGGKDAAVHSYYNGQDQLDHQMDQFRGRTSLFHEQLSRGNASLLLKEVQVSDRGRYTCYTSKSREDAQESSVNLEVEGEKHREKPPYSRVNSENSAPEHNKSTQPPETEKLPVNVEAALWWFRLRIILAIVVTALVVLGFCLYGGRGLKTCGCGEELNGQTSSVTIERQALNGSEDHRRGQEINTPFHESDTAGA
ncbi:CD276 antigen-like isoform X2 [Synchiropus splendidus]|nr:CD276 antigen-like isoform X2 [Synchiropus splendidus]XP_053716378.1 CD276 antigen-like isoform X2 [Synchiropus splendidus]XP_053716379.1 CD276 antigen-like isoform X2 [Synchiropus splendidus]